MPFEPDPKLYPVNGFEPRLVPGPAEDAQQNEPIPHGMRVSYPLTPAAALGYTTTTEEALCLTFYTLTP